MFTPVLERQVVSTLEDTIYYLSVEADDQEYRAVVLIASINKTLEAVRAELSGRV